MYWMCELINPASRTRGGAQSVEPHDTKFLNDGVDVLVELKLWTPASLQLATLVTAWPSKRMQWLGDVGTRSSLSCV